MTSTDNMASMQHHDETELQNGGYLERKRAVLWMMVVRARERRYHIQQSIISNLVRRRMLLLKVCLMLVVLLKENQQNQILHPQPQPRRWRRLERNTVWWDLIWNTYSPDRFKRTFRVSRETFAFILNRIRGSLEKQSVTEDAVPPEFRSGVCIDLAEGIIAAQSQNLLVWVH